MIADEVREVLDFEGRLTPGSPVVFRFTRNFNQYVGLGWVVRVNLKSVRVCLTEPLHYQTGAGEMQVGHSLSVPLFGDMERWSCNNRVEPVDSYSFDLLPNR